MAAFLLEIAADTFANHGCNDMDWKPLQLGVDEKATLEELFNEWNEDPENPQGFDHVGDASWMRFFAGMLEGEADELDDDT